MPDGKYITLKEAAEISGYAPDYIGQLIRSGKLAGKQIYYNVAWVTTETALHEYLAKGGNGKATSFFGQTGLKWDLVKNRIIQRFKADKAFKAVLYGVMSVSIMAFLYLFYVISVGINDKLEQRALEHVEEQALMHSVDDSIKFESF
jgi:hypothetical protein